VNTRSAGLLALLSTKTPRFCEIVLKREAKDPSIDGVLLDVQDPRGAANVALALPQRVPHATTSELGLARAHDASNLGASVRHDELIVHDEAHRARA
jgi:hypothetical protein